MLRLDVDTMLPSQFHTARAKGPAQALMAAVLEHALHDLSQPRTRTPSLNCQRRTARNDAVCFFESDDRHWPYSFVNICDVLGIDPGWVRQRLGLVLSGHIRTGCPGPRPTVRRHHAA